MCKNEWKLDISVVLAAGMNELHSLSDNILAVFCFYFLSSLVVSFTSSYWFSFPYIYWFRGGIEMHSWKMLICNLWKCVAGWDTIFIIVGGSESIFECFLLCQIAETGNVVDLQIRFLGRVKFLDSKDNRFKHQNHCTLIISGCNFTALKQLDLGMLSP